MLINEKIARSLERATLAKGNTMQTSCRTERVREAILFAIARERETVCMCIHAPKEKGLLPSSSKLARLPAAAPPPAIARLLVDNIIYVYTYILDTKRCAIMAGIFINVFWDIDGK